MLTPKNQRDMDKRVYEYARKKNWPAVVRLIGGSGREDLEDYVYSEDSGAPRGAPNFY